MRNFSVAGHIVSKKEAEVAEKPLAPKLTVGEKVGMAVSGINYIHKAGERAANGVVAGKRSAAASLQRLKKLYDIVELQMAVHEFQMSDEERHGCGWVSLRFEERITREERERLRTGVKPRFTYEQLKAEQEHLANEIAGALYSSNNCEIKKQILGWALKSMDPAVCGAIAEKGVVRSITRGTGEVDEELAELVLKFLEKEAPLLPPARIEGIIEGMDVWDSFYAEDLMKTKAGAERLMDAMCKLIELVNGTKDEWHVKHEIMNGKWVMDNASGAEKIEGLLTRLYNNKDYALHQLTEMAVSRSAGFGLKVVDWLVAEKGFRELFPLAVCAQDAAVKDAARGKLVEWAVAGVGKKEEGYRYLGEEAGEFLGGLHYYLNFHEGFGLRASEAIGWIGSPEFEIGKKEIKEIVGIVASLKVNPIYKVNGLLPLYKKNKAFADAADGFFAEFLKRELSEDDKDILAHMYAITLLEKSKEKGDAFFSMLETASRDANVNKASLATAYLGAVPMMNEENALTAFNKLKGLVGNLEAEEAEAGLKRLVTEAKNEAVRDEALDLLINGGYMKIENLAEFMGEMEFLGRHAAQRSRSTGSASAFVGDRILRLMETAGGAADVDKADLAKAYRYAAQMMEGEDALTAFNKFKRIAGNLETKEMIDGIERLAVDSKNEAVRDEALDLLINGGYMKVEDFAGFMRRNRRGSVTAMEKKLFSLAGGSKEQVEILSDIVKRTKDPAATARRIINSKLDGRLKISLLTKLNFEEPDEDFEVPNEAIALKSVEDVDILDFVRDSEMPGYEKILFFAKVFAFTPNDKLAETALDYFVTCADALPYQKASLMREVLEEEGGTLELASKGRSGRVKKRLEELVERGSEGREFAELVYLAQTKTGMRQVVDSTRAGFGIEKIDSTPEMVEAAEYLRRKLEEKIVKAFPDPERPPVEVVLNGVDAIRPEQNGYEYEVDVLITENSIVVKDNGTGIALDRVNDLVVPFNTSKSDVRNIGRFGVGFLSNLRYCLEDERCVVSVDTRYLGDDGKEHAYRIAFWSLGEGMGNLRVQFDDGTRKELGTTVSIMGTSHTDGVESYVSEMMGQLDRARARITVNGKEINAEKEGEAARTHRFQLPMEFAGQSVMQNARVTYDPDAKESGITLLSQGVFVETLTPWWAKGIGSLTIDCPSGVEINEDRNELRKDSDNFRRIVLAAIEGLAEMDWTEGGKVDLQVARNRAAGIIHMLADHTEMGLEQKADAILSSQVFAGVEYVFNEFTEGPGESPVSAFCGRGVDGQVFLAMNNNVGNTIGVRLEGMPAFFRAETKVLAEKDWDEVQSAAVKEGVLEENVELVRNYAGPVSPYPGYRGEKVGGEPVLVSLVGGEAGKTPFYCYSGRLVISVGHPLLREKGFGARYALVDSLLLALAKNDGRTREEALGSKVMFEMPKARRRKEEEREAQPSEEESTEKTRPSPVSEEMDEQTIEDDIEDEIRQLLEAEFG